jgi:AcrR family transcriptional regulator
MTERPRPTTRDADATRQHLLRAGLELYSTRGFLATTTPMLAQRAGIAEGTIYRHFASKEQLLNAVYLGTQEWALKLVREHEGERNFRVRERLQSVGRRLVEAAGRDPAPVRMLLRPPDPALLDDRSREAAREVLDVLQQLIAMGKSDGIIRPGPAELWAGVWLRVVSWAVDRVLEGEWPVDHPQIGPTLDAAWAAIAGDQRSGGPAV